MSLASEALHYRKGGVTYDVPLYTTAAEGGPERLAVRVGGNIRYVTLPPIGDSRATDLRVQRAGVIRSIGGHAIAYNPTWTLIGQSGLTWITPSPYGPGTSNTFTTTASGVSFDHEVLFSSVAPYNLKTVWTGVSGANRNLESYRVRSITPGDPQPVLYQALNIGETAYYRAPTGAFDIDMALREYIGTDWNFYAGGVTVYRVAP